MLVFGSISHRMVTDGTLTGFTGSDGYYGIVVALFAGLSPLWTIASAYLFAGLLVGGVSMGIALGVPYSQDLVTLIVGLLVCFVVALDAARKRSNLQAGRSAEAWHQLLAIALPRLRADGAPAGLEAAGPGQAQRPMTAAGPVRTVDAQAKGGQVPLPLAPAERSKEAPQ
jgi:hypothetical protein